MKVERKASQASINSSSSTPETDDDKTDEPVFDPFRMDEMGATELVQSWFAFEEPERFHAVMSPPVSVDGGVVSGRTKERKHRSGKRGGASSSGRTYSELRRSEERVWWA